MKWFLGLSGGLVVANPIPVPDGIPAEQITGMIDGALADMHTHDVRSRDTTPYLLGRIVELTGGEPLAANIALVHADAQFGAEIAAAYAQVSGSRRA